MEKRKHKRAAKEFAVNITSAELDGQRFRFDRNPIYPKLYNESGVDFTHVGVRLMCSKVLSENTRVTLKMLIPDNGKIHAMNASGTVKWSREVEGPHKKYFHMGIQIDKVDGEGADILKRLWQKYA